MDLYVIRRRDAWASPQELEATGGRSAAEGDKPDSGVRWIRSYVVAEESGRLGTVCIYQAESPEAIGPTPTHPACRPTRSCRSRTP